MTETNPTGNFDRIPEERPSTSSTSEEARFAHERQKQAQSLGFFGKIFGNLENARLYLFFFLTIGLIVITAFYGKNLLPEVLQAFLALLTSITGYLFGTIHARQTQQE